MNAATFFAWCFVALVATPLARFFFAALAAATDSVAAQRRGHGRGRSDARFDSFVS